MTAWIVRLHAHDERALHALVLRRRPTLDRAMHAVTHLGDAAFTVGITVLMMLGAIPGLREVGFHAAFALVGSHLVVQMLKRTVSRARPRMPEGFAALVQPPDRFSFPSGHAASSLSVALALATVLPGPAGVAVLAFAALTGMSRCYLGVHYPGDVIVGWGLAVVGLVSAGVVIG
ncbi:phosphatase PAP2 family protein [Longimicrobium sp.]|uniref:phosphatase PAP2 family protein n=1 Tax=Longimicrobium sp. TaxID=2029185 RepID=UPI002E380D0F|nr:phosphatase PAP2 family protein [Longimicrobium sp.]HEX6039654.1 phosphatase PAP2 family protein [Longimicrobium sp.]